MENTDRENLNMDTNGCILKNNEDAVSDTSYSELDQSETNCDKVNGTLNSNYEDCNSSKFNVSDSNDSANNDDSKADKTLTNNDSFDATTDIGLSQSKIKCKNHVNDVFTSSKLVDNCLKNPNAVDSRDNSNCVNDSWGNLVSYNADISSKPINSSWDNLVVTEAQDNSEFINGSWDNLVVTEAQDNSEFINGSWENLNSSVDQNNEKYKHDDYENDVRTSFGNGNNTKNKKKFESKSYTSRQYQTTRNIKSKTSNDSSKVKSQSEKSTVPKPTYIPPKFEDNDNLCVEAGSNFVKYDKIDVIVSGVDVPKNISSFENSGLCEILICNLTNCNYVVPTPIQKYALPIIMNGRDMIASAQTGSGKTAAFVLPILSNLLSNPTKLVFDFNHCEPQVLILSPTRELAIQICEVTARLSKGTLIKSELLYGGTATYYQKEKILKGVHIIVATPGRLLDFIKRGLITLNSLRFFVLDEADRMLDMGFQNDVEQILNDNTMVLSEERLTVMFSATLPENVQQIAKSYLKTNYISVAVGEIGGACKDVNQVILKVPKFKKKTKLVDLLRNIDDCQGTIVFVEQKRNADFIAAYLSESDFPTTSIHGDRQQSEREIALKDFKTKKMKILVATAVGARGLDIMGVTMVVNFDLPKTIEEYVHRIGRTGRLGNSGKAVSFFDPQNDKALAPYLVNTLQKADQNIPEFLTQYNNSPFEDFNQFNDIRTDETVTSVTYELPNHYHEDEEDW